MYQEMMSQMVSAPGAWDRLAALNPQMRGLLDANPQMRCVTFEDNIQI